MTALFESFTKFQLLPEVTHSQKFGGGLVIQPNISSPINLNFYAFITTYFSSLGQQYFSVIVALLQPEILITLANFNASQGKQMHKTLTHKTNNVSGRGIFALYPTTLVLCDY